MRKTKHILSFLLILSILATLPSTVIQASAAEITSPLTIEALASGTFDVLGDIESAIQAGSKDSDGVYYGFTFPADLTFGSGTISTEAYALMAAQALMALSTGEAATTAIAYQNITFEIGDVKCGNGASLTKGQYLDLAERAMKYGCTLSKLPTSFNRPSDGTNTYDGRISNYSLVHIFAEALAAYSSEGTLPQSVTFLPTHRASAEEETPSESTEPTTESIETSEPDGISLTVIGSEAKQLKAWIETNKAMPNYCTLDTGDVYYPAQMLYVLCEAIVDVNNGDLANTYECASMDEPSNPTGSITTQGTIKKSEYITMAKNVINFMNSNSTGPNYCTSSSLGTVQYQETVYFFAKIMAHYYTNKVLPDSMTVTSWLETTGQMVDGEYVGGDATFGADYSSLSAYTVPTRNCQSNNATIISVARTGMYYSGGKYSNPTNTYQAMYNLFEYLNDKTSYESPMYYNTKRGALGTWTAKTGNCCDMAHLVNACARSLGVPARYRHGYCVFSSGLRTGHVWADVYCGSSYGWKIADLVSGSNYLGYKTSSTSYYYSDDCCITLGY